MGVKNRMILAALWCTAAVASEVLDKINFDGASVMQVLTIYREFSGEHLIIDSRVKTLDATVTLRVGPEASNEAAATALKMALLRQTGGGYYATGIEYDLGDLQ